MRVAIVDVGLSNSKSVANAFEHLGCKVSVTGAARDLEKIDNIVLPGVGTFQEGMRRLESAGLDAAIRDAVQHRGSKILGICLGMQLLCHLGTEGGSRKGLGIVDASVVSLDHQTYLPIRLPHVGYNSVRHDPTSILFRGFDEDADFYFVHSYHCDLSSDRGRVSWATYGVDFAAAFEEENIFATQFHPEKSATNGLRVLRNFLEA